MTLNEIGWGQFLGSDPPLPPDVTFMVVEGEAVVGELRAHKYFLASVSTVFRKQFFGKLAEKKDIIDIKETTFDAFKFLLNYIYNGVSDVNEGGRGLEEIFEIINLAEKYGMKTLSDEILKLLDEMDIEEANVVEVARTANVFKHFEAISKQLLTKCSDFLKLTLINDDELAVFCDSFVEYPEDQQIVLDLLNMREEVDGSQDIDLIDVDELNQDKVCVALPLLSRMCLKNVNWLEFLTYDSEIPPDVTFEILELPKYNDAIGHKVVIGEIKAHKYYLATISEVFKDQFFSEASIQDIEVIGETTGDTIEIIGPSFNAFKVMIDYIYGKYPTLRGAGEICEIFEIINLAERFKISGLEEEYRTAMFLYFRER